MGISGPVLCFDVLIQVLKYHTISSIGLIVVRSSDCSLWVVSGRSIVAVATDRIVACKTPDLQEIGGGPLTALPLGNN